MEIKGKRCIVEPFSTAAAEIKASFDTTFVTTAFQEGLSKYLAKEGLSIQPAGVSIGPEDLVIRGQFRQIDEGSRLLRYMLTFLAGKATVEVQGELLQGSNKMTDLYAKASQRWAIFGGRSEELLEICAKATARKVSGQVIKELKRR